MFARKRRITMLVSAGPYVGGRSYRLPAELADSFIVKGYASGELSREYDSEAKNRLRGGQQVVRL